MAIRVRDDRAVSPIHLLGRLNPSYTGRREFVALGVHIVDLKVMYAAARYGSRRDLLEQKSEPAIVLECGYPSVVRTAFRQLKLDFRPRFLTYQSPEARQSPTSNLM